MTLKPLEIAGFLFLKGLKNRVRRQLQRMRQPKNFFAMVAGLSYLWWFLIRRAQLSGSPSRLPAKALPLVEAALVALAIIGIGSAWIFGSAKGTLTFTESEVQVLFPAPMTRAMLLQYRLSKLFLGTLGSALISSLFVGRFLTAHALFFILGSWIALFTMTLHSAGATLTRASLIENGRFGLKRRRGTLAVALAVIGLLATWVVWVRQPTPPIADWSVANVSLWVTWVMSQRPLSWILWPIRCPIQLALAQDGGAFLRALPGGLAVAGLHYAWVISSHASFEEAAVEAAERRARLVEAWRSGQRGALVRRLGRRKRTPFTLAGTGRPEVALLWKNLVAMIRGESHRAMLVTLVLGAGIAAILLKQRVDFLFSLGCLLMAFFVALLGPDTLRQDLRQDLSHMEILRSLPLSGRRVVLAEILAPGLALSGVEVLLIIGSLAFSLNKPLPGFPPPARLAIALGLLLLLPALTFLNLLLRNAAVLLFPSWMAGDPHQARGFEVMGQRLLTLAANLMLMLVAVLPAGIAGGLLLLVLWGSVGALAAVLASGLAAAVLLVELYFGLVVLGKLFDRFDVSV
jgi:hypothetical protein